MNRTTFVLSVLLAAGSLPAMDFDQLIQGALENDRQMELLRLSIENKELRLQRSQLDDPFSISVGTGSSDVSFYQAFSSAPTGSSTVVSLDPYIELDLGDPYDTGIELDLPMSLNLNSGGNTFTVSPSVSISQPLNPLFGWEESTELEDLEDFVSLEGSRVSILSRELVIKKALLQLIRELKLMERSRIQMERDVQYASNELEKTRALGTYSPESAKYQRLEVDLRRLQQDQEMLNRNLQSRWKRLERVVGTNVDSLPDQIPSANLALPDDPEETWNTSIYFAAFDEKIARLVLEEEDKEPIPTFSVSGSYGMSITSDAVPPLSNHTLSGSLSGDFEDFSIYASLSGNFSGKSLSAAFGFSWSLPDNRADGLIRKERENDLEVARLNLASARESFGDSLEALRMGLLNLEYRTQSASDERMITELELQEAQARFEIGIINEDTLDAAVWKVEKLAYDEYVLAIDKLMVQHEIEALLLLKD
jgi:hypothetical protein